MQSTCCPSDTAPPFLPYTRSAVRFYVRGVDHDVLRLGSLVCQDIENALKAVGRHQTARVNMQMVSKPDRRRSVSTRQDSTHGEPVAANVRNQNFRCDRPDQIGAHTMHIWTGAGWLNLAIVVDLYSRRIVGWETRDRLKKARTISALNKAIAIRQPRPGLIQHSDRGSQYASHAYCTLRKAHNIIPSMSGKGNCYDTAMVETVFKTIKAELLWRTAFLGSDAAIKAVGADIDGFYTPMRRHSALG